MTPRVKITPPRKYYSITPARRDWANLLRAERLRVIDAMREFLAALEREER